MAIAAPRVDQPPSNDALVDAPFWYEMYGRRIRSWFELPIAAARENRLTDTYWTFRRAAADAHPPIPDRPALNELRCEHGDVVLSRYGTPRGVLLVNPVVGTFHITTGAHPIIEVYPQPGIDEWLLGLVLMGQISVFVLHQLDHFVLHASAVVANGGAIAFLGPKGRGKSTMAAVFLKRGAALLTDDALPLRHCDGRVFAEPGLPLMKVSQRASERTLGLVHHQLHALTETVSKKLFLLDERFAFAREAVPLQCIYVLEREPESSNASRPHIEQLSQREGLTALLAQTSLGALLTPAEAARLLGLYARVAQQATMYRLRYPTGERHQAAVYEEVMARVVCA